MDDFLEQEDRAIERLFQEEPEDERMEEEPEKKEGLGEKGEEEEEDDASAGKENRQYLGARPVRPGRDPKPIGARARMHLRRVRQAIANEGPWERPPLAPMQRLDTRKEIPNPRKNPNRIERPRLRRDRQRRRTSTTREDRLEALQMLDSGQEWDIQYK
jgi:hypothetical protein